MNNFTQTFDERIIGPIINYFQFDFSAGYSPSLCWEFFLHFRFVIFPSLLFLLILILFCYMLKFNNGIKPAKFNRSRNFKLDLVTWRETLIKMRYDQKVMSGFLKFRFYISRLFFSILICWGLFELYLIGFYQTYLYYGQIVYTIILVLEYIFIFSGLSQELKINYNRTSNTSTCLLIPFGGGDIESKIPVIRKVIDHALNLFEPSAIFLLHNGKEFVPKAYDNLVKVRDEYGIRYVYLPLPNKTYTIYYAAKNLAKDYDQCLIIDDDVMLPKDIRIPQLESNISCAAYPICASMPDREQSETMVGKIKNNITYGYERTIASFQNIEYTLSGLLKMMQSNWNNKSSPLSQHGAIGLWKISALILILKMHDGVFHGEDLLMGILAFLNNFNMKVIDEGFIPTVTPRKIFGIGGLFKQRVNSWDYIVLKYVFPYIKLLFFTDITKDFILKIFIFHELWTIFIDAQRIPVVAYMLYTNPVTLVLFTGFLMFVNLCMAFWCNYVIIPKHQRSTFLSIVLYPLYKMMLVIFRLLGELKYLFKFTTVRFRTELQINSFPELPNILENTEWTLDNLHTIRWDLIWDDREYIRKSMKVSEENNTEINKTETNKRNGIIIRKRNSTNSESDKSSNKSDDDILIDIEKLMEQLRNDKT